jgi:SAM-dependent methyltransferase
MLGGALYDRRVGDRDGEGETDPFARHAADVREWPVAGDPRMVKESYRRLGTYLDDRYGGGEDDPPVLSWPETAAAVTAAVPAGAERILDAGCGPNPAASHRLARPGRTIITLDIGLGTVALAVAGGRRAGATFCGVVADVELLPFRPGGFDAVVCDDTIEHVPDPAVAVGELAKSLRPGGVAVIATPNRHRLSVLTQRAGNRMRGRRPPASSYYAAGSHLREYTPRELEQLLGASFTVERFVPVGSSLTSPASRAAGWLVRRGPFRRFTKVVVAVAHPRGS